VRRKRNGDYKVPPGTCLYTCFTSDFFLEDADPWRDEAWAMIRQRADLHFMMITKRVDRLLETLPADWGAGYAHVTIGCTIENQDRANYRLPFYRAAPLARKFLVCEPLLEPIDLRPHDIGAWVEQVIVGGESGHDARPCDFSWIMALHDTCVASNVSFLFKQTGARFMKDGKSYSIARHLQHAQARKAGINFNASRPAIF
jgi:protein gp37